MYMNNCCGLLVIERKLTTISWHKFIYTVMIAFTCRGGHAAIEEKRTLMDANLDHMSQDEEPYWIIMHAHSPILLLCSHAQSISQYNKTACIHRWLCQGEGGLYFSW